MDYSINNNSSISEDDFSDIKPLHFNSEKDLNKELEEISEATKDNKADWRKREAAIKKLGGVVLSNMSNNVNFIKIFNQKLCLNLSVQLVDLRTSLMKEACRIAILVSKTYGEAVESAIEKMVSPLVLYKLVGSANRLISETGAHCISEIIKYIESPKIIMRIHEQAKNKNSTVKLRACQELLHVITYYSKQTLNKQINLIEEFIQLTTHDASLEVRQWARKLFVKYMDIFPTNANKLINLFDNNVVKTINDDLSTSSNVNSSSNINIEDKSLNLIHTNKLKTPFSNNKDPRAVLAVADVNSETQEAKNCLNSNSNSNVKMESSKLRTLTSTTVDVKTYYDTASPQKHNQAIVVSKPFSKTESKNILSKVNNLYSTLGNSGNSNSTKTQGKIEKHIQTPTQNSTNIDDSVNRKLDHCNLNNAYNSNKNSNDKPKFKNIEDLIKTKINTILTLPNNELMNKIANFEQISFFFNEIYTNIDNISKVTLKNLISVHISNLSETHHKLTIQVMKNLTKFIFYLEEIFNEESIYKIVKIVILNISSENEQIVKSANSLLEIMRKKIDPNLIIKPIIKIFDSEVGDVIYEICFEVIIHLVDTAVITLSEQNYLNNFIKKIVKILEENISNGYKDTNLKYRIMDTVEIIYRKYPNQLLKSTDELGEKRKVFLNLLEENKKVIFEYLNKGSTSTAIKNKNKSNNSTIDNSENADKIANISSESKTKMGTPPFNKTNNYNNYLFADEFDTSDVNFEILQIAFKNETSSFISYLKSDPNSNVPNFLLALIEIKFEQTFLILVHLQKIISSKTDRELFIDHMPLLLNRLIFLLDKFSSEYLDILKEIISLIPVQLDNEMYLQVVPKYITSRQSPHIVQILLLSIKDVISDFYNNPENLLLLLPSFIETVFNTLNHHISDVRKLAVYLIVDLYFILGKDFETYLSELNPSHRNLINIYIKKREEGH